MRTIIAAAILAAAAAPALAAPTLTFDTGAMTTIDGVMGYLEGNVFMTGGFSLADVNGDGSIDMTMTPVGGDVSIRILTPDAAAWHFEYDRVGNPLSRGPVEYDHAHGFWIGGWREDLALHHLSDNAAGGPMNFAGNTLNLRQNITWSGDGQTWQTGGTMTMDNLEFTQLAELPPVMQPVPEPSTYALLAAGLGLLGLMKRRAANR
jgi:hypothetical protein